MPEEEWEEFWPVEYIVDKNGRKMRKPTGRPKKGATSQAANNYTIYFRKNAPRPWLCLFCNEEVAEIKRGMSVVHHKDHDRSHNTLENLSAAHKLCHDRHHLNGRVITWGGKISESKKEAWKDGTYNKIWETRRARYGSTGTRNEVV